MVYVFYDFRAPSEVYEKLSQMGFVPLKVEKSESLSGPVCGHADLSVAKIGKTLLIRGEVARRYPFLASLEGVFVSDEDVGEEYPSEAKFCVKVVGDTLYHGKVVAEDALRIAKAEGLSTSAVRQGYVACNLLVLDAHHVITSDLSLANALSLRGVKVLRIREGGISLPPYPYGFIGGASGVYGNTVYFLGDVMRHPDGEKIMQFVASCAMEVCCLYDGELFDGGGLVFWESRFPPTVGENS